MIKLNQKKMKVAYRKAGELNNGDVAQCPLCRKKFVVLPGMIQFKIGGGADVLCPECGKPTLLTYYAANPVELPARPRVRDKKKEE
jgi:hypothetical protein